MTNLNASVQVIDDPYAFDEDDEVEKNEICIDDELAAVEEANDESDSDFDDE